MDIQIKRAYDPAKSSDGKRLLVDRLWPRGISKDRLHIDDWLKDLAPSEALRHWFNHEPEKWEGFKKRYVQELDALPEAMQALRTYVATGTVTLVYAAKDEDHNNAVALRAYLQDTGKKHH